MHRTQIYLKDSERRMLHLISQREHVSLSELIRRAIQKTYCGKGRDGDVERAVDRRAGMWAGREDMPSTRSHVRSLRRGKRLEKLHG